jgi:hypothetical protein
MSGHLKGRGFNAGSYTAGCRCPACTDAYNAWVRNSLSHKAYSKAQTAALKWVRANHPEAWQSLVTAAYVELGAERRPPGRPKGS